MFIFSLVIGCVVRFRCILKCRQRVLLNIERVLMCSIRDIVGIHKRSRLLLYVAAPFAC